MTPSNGKNGVKSRTRGRSRSRIRRGLEDRGGIWERLLEMPLVWATVTVVVCTSLLLPRLDTDTPTWNVGDVATFERLGRRLLGDELRTDGVTRDVSILAQVPAVRRWQLPVWG